jgi:hypothetical protein
MIKTKAPITHRISLKEEFKALRKSERHEGYSKARFLVLSSKDTRHLLDFRNQDTYEVSSLIADQFKAKKGNGNFEYEIDGEWFDMIDIDKIKKAKSE